MRLRVMCGCLLLLLAGGLSDGRAQDARLTLSNPTALRDVIEQHEAAGDYSSMIFAAVELRDTSTSPEDRIFAQRSVGRAYALLGDRDRAIEAFNRAVDLVEPGMSPTLLAELYRDTAGMLGELGRFEQALTVVERGLATLEGVDDPDLLGALLVMRASILGALGRLDEALSSIQEAMDRPLSTPRQRIKRRNNLGMIHKWRGELEPAMAAFEAVYEAALADGSEQLIVYGLLELGDVERLLGNLRAARAHLEESLQRSQQAEEERWQLYAHRYLAELEDAEGNGEAAASHRAEMQRIQTELQNEAIANRAQVLEISLEVLEREQEIDRLQMERELQEARLERSRAFIVLAAIAGLLLLIALWLAVQKGRVRASANRELDKLASTDPLTGLYNRRRFVENLDQLRQTDPAHGALILIDLDRFKRVNDEHGHEHGDIVLKEVASRIQAMMRSEDRVARWGGEEFLAFLPNCSGDTAVQVAERVLEAIQTPPIEYRGVLHSITATIGVAETGRERDFDQALRGADEALYRGKRDGRNTVRAVETGRSEAY